MRVRVLAFARVRELLATGERSLELGDGATLRDAWNALVRECTALDPLAASTRLARNGRVANDLEETLADGDELALLPPAGGG